MFEAVKSSPSQADLAGGRIYTTGTVEGPDGPGDNVPKPFIVIRFSVAQPPLTSLPGAKIKQQTAQVWLHTLPGTMLPTDDFMAELEEWVPAQAPSPYDKGNILSCDWQYTSDDGWDDHYQTVTRYATFTATLKQTS